MRDAYYQAVAKLPQPLTELFSAVTPADAGQVTEIRLRAGRPVCLIFSGSARYLMPNSTLKDFTQGAVVLTSQQIETCFLALCSYSVHSVQNQLRQGYLTLEGGHRVGVAGTAVCEGSDVILHLKDITSLNIRIARRIRTQTDPLVRQAVDTTGGILLAGEPKSGKTTLLRQISTLLSDDGLQVSVIDQRRELWPADAETVEQLPANCDVLSGYPKAEGILQALRSLSPDVILCDEVGSLEDARAIEAGANAGVRMIASIHAGSKQEFLRRPQSKLLLGTGAFTKLVLLKGQKMPGQVDMVYDCADLS